MSVNSVYSKDNLSTIVANYIKDKILAMELKAGDRIIEKKISDDLSISRAPIREAIKELEKEGVITTIPRKGAHVTEFSMNDLKEIFEIRLLLEYDIIKILVNENLLTGSDMKQLTDIVDEMVRVAISTDASACKWITINFMDMSFHTYLWEKSGSMRRVKILKDMFFQLRIAMMYDTRLTDNLFNTASDHYAIIKSLAAKDIEATQRNLKNHIMTCRDQ